MLSYGRQGTVNYPAIYTSVALLGGSKQGAKEHPGAPQEPQDKPKGTRGAPLWVAKIFKNNFCMF